MISVRSRNGRELGLEMGETELEEGEAPCYNDGGGGDSTIDPDVSLSYIEEKIHNVLGHFQKDFEGLVSVEDLGAKYGTYGSFLPTYQRSPTGSHYKSTEARNYDSPSSPRKTLPEGRRQHPLVSSTSSPSWKSREALGKAISLGSSLRGNGHQLPSRHLEQSSSIGIITKPTSDQNCLKVRLKVGPEKLSMQKKAELYSGLGLEMSPSSSSDDGPAVSAGHLHEIEESPTSILQAMTSLPGDSPLLSPLPGSLILLTENMGRQGKYETKMSKVLPNGSLSGKGGQRVLDKEILKPSERNESISTELANRILSSDQDANISFMKNEKDDDPDISGCEELVSNALKLPVLLGPHDSDADPSKRTVDVKGQENSSLKEHLISEPIQETRRPGKKLGRKLGSRNKLPKSKTENAVDNIAASSQNVVIEAEKSPAFEQSEPDISTRKKALDDESSADPHKSLVAKAGISDSEGGSKRSIEKPTGRRKEKKIIQGIGSQNSDTPKDQSMAVVSSATTKSGMKFGASSMVSKNDSRYRHNGPAKPVDLYKDFFGDAEFEDDNESVSEDITSLGQLGDPQHVSKRSSSESHSTSKEKRDAGNPHTSDKHPSIASQVAPTGHGPSSEAPMSMVPLVNEHWVSCDKCHTWRLLPLGTNPESLPEKWVCRMLTWLPGMNRCNVPEDATTNALRALYNPALAIGPTSDNQQFQLNTSGQDFQNAATQSAPSGGKKKHGPAKATNLDGVSQHMQESSGKVNKHAGKVKTSLVTRSDKGTNVKVKSKRESELEDSRASKRVRSVDVNIDCNNLICDNGGTSAKATRDLANLSINGSGYGQNKHSKHKDLRESENKDVVSPNDTEIHIPRAEDESPLHLRSDISRDSLKKRKSKLLNSSEIFSEQTSTSGPRNQESKDFAEQTSEYEHRKDKKVRVSKSGLKDTTSESKVSSGTERKGRSTTMKHPFVASHSSSSKVSGSDKNKTGNQEEAKGSPVESVSSSPLRFASNEKVVPLGKNPAGKDDFHEPGSLTYRSELSKENVKATESSRGSLEHVQVDNAEKPNSRKNKLDEHSGTPNKGEKLISRKVTSGGTFSESREQSQNQSHHDGIKVEDKKRDISLDPSIAKLSEKTDLAEHSGTGKVNSLPPLARAQAENVSNNNAIDNGDGQKSQMTRKKSENQNGQQPTSTRHQTANLRKDRAVEAPSPLRRDSSSHAANSALKEAKDLKHLADRLKNSGSADSNGFYFQAALKFLHGASLLESGSSESTKHNELMHSMHIYSSTAKLCEFCAHEYEKSNDMAAAALAYKCVEVAYMRVVYSSNASASRDRNDLQRALQIVPPGESPSSSASDIDNLNNQASTDKAALAMVAGSPQVSGSHVMTSRSRTGFLKILNFAQDVNSAMEASRKSRIAFSAATSRHADSPHKESISSLKKALDFSFQDIEALLRLVRIAVEAICR